MNITLIAAVGKNRELGLGNDLIWKIPEDMKFFRDNTLGKPIIMGINTFNSLPRVLPNRKHIVLTHRELELDKDIIVVHSIEELLTYIKEIDSEVMVIGGAKIYSLMIDYADRMLLTEIDADSIADVYFPRYDMKDWDRDILSEHEYDGIEYRHVSYTRRRVR